MPIQLSELNEIGKQALDGLLALIPEDQREAARSQYSRAQDQMRTALTDVTGQIEAEKRELGNWRTNLEGWARGKEDEFTTRERALKAKETTQPSGGTPPTGQPPTNQPPTNQPPAGQYLTREEMASAMDDFGRNVVGAHAEILGLQHRHAQLYGGSQPFNLVELVSHPVAKTRGMTAAFEELHKERIAAVASDAQKKHDDQIRAEERQKVLQEMGSANRMPFPITGEDDSPLAIIARRNADNTEQYGAQAATDFYRQNVANGTFKNPAA